jgi:colanic acid biosynthesis glycosyl transferase WcaI
MTDTNDASGGMRRGAPSVMAGPLLIHDYAGHAFTVELARWFALQGIETHYWYSQGIESPRGNLQCQPGDADCLVIRGVGGGAVSKYSLRQRIRRESAYGRIVASEALELAPAVILSNAPPQIQARLRKAVSTVDGRFV